MMYELPAALAPLGAYQQFIIYKWLPSASRPGKTDKFPCNPLTLAYPVNAHDPANWLSSDHAIAITATLGDSFGVGFVFTDNDPFFFVDLDDAALEDGSGWKPHALSICQALQGAAIEVSLSGRGLHIFGTGRPPSHRCESVYKIGGFYHNERFVALTGVGCSGNAAMDCSAILPAVVTTYWAPDPHQISEGEWTQGPVPEWNGPAEDTDLIQRAINSQSAAAAFGSKASFADLWFANEAALSKFYPDQFSTRGYDPSLADSALAQHLAFWTGKDCERMQRIMQGSQLVRDKWEREDYLPRTIRGVVARQTDVLHDKRLELPGHSATLTIGAGPTAVATEGETMLTGENQIKLFAGSVYIGDQNKALIAGGRLLKPDQFRVHFGGFSFQMDRGNEKISRDAWEAWTQSQIFKCPRVDGTCFRPDLEPGTIVERSGQTFANTYYPVQVPRKLGDVSPFLIHLAKILPDKQDQTKLLSYMAACVQHKGIKFQWAVLLQGVEGNGKTLFTRCVAEAVGRRYVHWPKASKLCNQFNSWMVGKLFYAVEDIVTQNSRIDVINELKPMITGGDGLEIEAKGIDQTSSDICGNFMFNCNPKDGLLKTKNDRRFCVFYTAQQQEEDLTRDGMQGEYFPRLYEWLRADGYAIVNELLHTYQIPAALNPAGECQRAPLTTSTQEAIAASTGNIEQEILEAVSQGLPGFTGGWISSIYLERLLEHIGRQGRMSHSKRKEMLNQLGYIWHPAFKDGRPNNPVVPDNGKPRLYIHQSSLARQITNPAEAAKAYETANGNRANPSAAAAFGPFRRA